MGLLNLVFAIVFAFFVYSLRGSKYYLLLVVIATFYVVAAILGVVGMSYGSSLVFLIASFIYIAYLFIVYREGRDASYLVIMLVMGVFFAMNLYSLVKLSLK